MKRTTISKIQTALFLTAAVLMAVLLLYLWFTPNQEVRQSREASGYATVQNVAYDETTDAEGRLVRRFRFTLDEVAYDATLAFFFCHQDAAVYLDGEQVYALGVAPQLSIVRTSGCSWAMLPLYREDTGKEVVVELTPVYKNYRDQKIEFLVGSKYAICTAQLVHALPEMLLGLLDVLAGLLLMGAAVYFSQRGVGERGLYALGLLAISMALWNFTQTRVASLLLGGKNVFVYYLSLIMLMISVLPLIKSVRRPRKKVFRGVLNGLCIAAAVFDVVQLVLQLTGVADIRQTLTLTHAMLLIGAVTLVTNSGVALVRRLRAGARPESDFIWIMGVGILGDLALYYLSGGDSGLPFTLLTLFLYVMSEGIRVFTGYVRQLHTLEEKETQLTMSRVTTMMSQIRSHFVFNLLNAISGMCKYDPEKADETVVRFARYLRNNIDIMEDDKSIPFSVELERLEDYVILEQVRFGERIRFETDIQADCFSLPPLILQPVVENAIKHGLGPKEEGGTITLRTREAENAVIITVADDGVGFDTNLPAREGAVGLRNIEFRLQHLVGGSMEIESRIDVGTTVTITIPISVPKENTP